MTRKPNATQSRAVLLLIGLILVEGPIELAQPAFAREQRSTPPIAHAQTNTRPNRGNVVTHWNQLAAEILPVEVGPVLDERAMAIFHAAIHDAINGVERRYEAYAAELSAPGASADAAVASAARAVLIALAPGLRDRIEQVYEAAVANVPQGPARDDGVNVGARAAQANLDRRAQDGIEPGPWPPLQGPIAEPVYVPTGTPGDYDFTPPFDAPPLGPVALFTGFGRFKPFVIDLTRHRLKGPDPLRSHQYARDFALVKSVGQLKSTTRTADQTETAFFWFQGVAPWNLIARTVIEQRNLDDWEAARILALMTIAMFDGGIACVDAKYHFRFWRPYTAIRRAAEDRNDATEPDANWLPLLWTPPDVTPQRFLIPPFPDYPSGAAVTSMAAAEVLTRLIGKHTRFEATSAMLPDVTRRFRSFHDAAHEAGWSRVYGGIHFRRAVEDGFAQGKSIGRDVSRMLPRAKTRD
jgi:hypothetical protein